MALYRVIWPLMRQAFSLYWLLVKIVLPVMVLTRLAVDLGIIELLAPPLTPLMGVMGLPPELGFAWVTCLLVGIWGGAVAAFAVVAPESLTTAQITIFASLMLIAHSLPIEQRISQKAGPGFWVTTALRLAGAFVFGVIVHRICQATGWLSEPAQVLWVPATRDPSWTAFARDAVESLAWMFVILLGLVALLRIMEATGLTRRLNSLLSPLLRVAGIGREATSLTMVGLLLGLSYGGGLIIQQARQGHLKARDIFLSIALMGLSHSLIEDTLLVVAMGADLTVVLFGRAVFSLIVVALLARVIALVPDAQFFRFLFSHPAGETRPNPVTSP